MNTNEYTALIAGLHKGKPKYTEWVYKVTTLFETAKVRLDNMSKDFDVDYAVGKQLDAVGARVGVERSLPMTLSNVYFALDDEGGIGLDLGAWKGEFDPVDGLNTLGDDTYRAVIKAKILANQWEGTNETLPIFLSTVLSYFNVPAKVLDFQDMSTMHVVLHMTKKDTPPIVWELFQRRIIDVTAAGVSLSIVDNDPWFGLDIETNSVKGLDGGYWFPLDEVIGNGD